MKVRTEHQNLGAVLMQIAEDDGFTAINPLRLWKGEKINNAFLINTDTCIFLKYGQEPKSTDEYQFTFAADILKNIAEAAKHYPKVFICLVCVEDQEICCIDLTQFNKVISARVVSAKKAESSYQILVTVPAGKSLRIYTNAAGRKGYIAGDEVVVSRSRFPKCLFT